MSKIDLKPLIEGQRVHNKIDTLLRNIAAEDGNVTALEEKDLSFGIVDENPEEVMQFMLISEEYLKVRLNPNGDEKSAVALFTEQFRALKRLSTKYKLADLPARQDNPLRPAVVVRGSFTAFAVLGGGDGNGTLDLVETEPVAMGSGMTPEHKKGDVDWDFGRYGIGFEKLSPKGVYGRLGYQGIFTFYDGEMNYDGEKVGGLSGQSFSLGLVGGVEYPFTDWLRGRLLANVNVEVGRFDTTLTDTDPEVDGQQNPIKDPCSDLQLGDAAGCEVERTLGIYWSLPVGIVAGVRLFDTVSIDFAWQRPLKMESGQYVFLPDEFNTFWLMIGLADSH